jgi:hypothetical protein
MGVPVNWWAVVVAALSIFVLGYLWFGLVFKKAWQRLSGVAGVKMSAASLIVALVGSFVMSYVFQHALVFASAYLKMSGVGGGLEAGFFNWLGFVAPVTIGIVTYQRKPFTLWLLQNAYWLLSLLVMGIILSAWT